MSSRHYFVTCEYLKPVNSLEPGGGGGQCLSYMSLQERREGLEAFQGAGGGGGGGEEGGKQ